MFFKKGCTRTLKNPKHNLEYPNPDAEIIMPIPILIAEMKRPANNANTIPHPSNFSKALVSA